MRKLIGYARMKIERRARWDRLWRPIDIILQNVETIYWLIRRIEVVECFGDSHVKVMRRLNWMYPELLTRFRTISVMGATAYGLTNRESSTSARTIFEKRLIRLPYRHKVLVKLGEIDAGFLVWFLAEKKGVSVDVILKKSVDHYTGFLNHVINMNKEVIVCSAPLPTIDYDQDTPEYLMARKAVNIPKKQRTDMTLKFNSMVRRFCEESDIIFVDLDALVLDENTRLLKGSFLNKMALDNHYNEEVYARALMEVFLSTGVIREKV